MKTLIIITTLISTFGISNLSFAFDPMELYINTEVEEKVEEELRNVCLLDDSKSYCQGQYYLRKHTNSVITSDQKTNDEYINIFGVQMPRVDRS
ncbi:hypothetical protein MYX76_09430 [Desulfobacterota bacterium AH_259_B03_O07]|nr:hypothetical protein [Desulfobacterota bacterium AH_259_B03_O07]